MKQIQVKIVTHCSCSSIGSILQSYALSKTLSHCGYNNTLLLEKSNESSRKHHYQGLRGCIKIFFRKLFFNKISEARCKRQNFIDSNLQTEFFSNFEELHFNSYRNANEVYLAGSDQVWHPDLCNPLFFWIL